MEVGRQSLVSGLSEKTISHAIVGVNRKFRTCHKNCSLLTQFFNDLIRLVLISPRLILVSCGGMETSYQHDRS